MRMWVRSLTSRCGVSHQVTQTPRCYGCGMGMAAAAPTQHLARQPPYAAGAALKRKKKNWFEWPVPSTMEKTLVEIAEISEK